MHHELDPDLSAAAQGDLPVAQLTLESPDWLRTGDVGEIRLTFRYLEPGNPQTALENLTLQSQLDLLGIPYTPTGEIAQALVRDHPVVFLWNLRGAMPGVYPGKVWLRVRPFSPAVDPEFNRLLAVQALEMRVVDLFGLSGDQCRVYGAVGMLLGAILGLDGVIQRVVNSNKKGI